MTCLEKFKIQHPECALNPHGFPLGCPHDRGYKERPDWCPGMLSAGACAMCWNRELPPGSDKINLQQPTVLYRCDRRACPTCSFPICQHTPDITHAVDFYKNGDGTYMEE